MLIRKTSQKVIITRIIIIVLAVCIVGIGAYVGYRYVDQQMTIQREKQAEIDRIAAEKAAAEAAEAKRKEPVYINLPEAQPVRALVEDYSLPSSIWALISKTHPFAVDYVPPNLKIPAVITREDKSLDERSLRADIEQPIVDMFTAAEAAGHHLMIGSGYRSAALQKIYFDSLASSIGEALANQSIAIPGQSEHQTGLAADISSTSFGCYLDNCFAATGDGQWLADNSYLYGFILRYPEGKEIITGYQYESWHFRYVGVELATALHASGLTLDEAWPYLQTADATLRQNGTIELQP